ncbi:hypothetical protein PHAVU_006G070000 [Phaseolus vulgaris]
MPTQPDSPNTLTQMFQNIFSDNSNIMLAAIISLLLVILFVLLLHLYAKWFLAQAQAQAHARRRRRRRRTTVTVSDVLGPARFHHFHGFNIEDSSPLSTKGLDSSTIRAIPLFIYEHNRANEDEELDCVICLSAFEGGEVGRCLPKCGHGFHVECIDMWLSSHSNCPICRAPIVVNVVESDSSQVVSSRDHGDEYGGSDFEIVIDAGSDESRESETGSGNGNGNGNVGARTSVSVSETSFSFFGCSLERMLGKVFPSTN